MLEKKISYAGTNILVYRYTKKCYYYPEFNGNYEVDITEYKQLCSYIRSCNYYNKLTVETLK